MMDIPLMDPLTCSQEINKMLFVFSWPMFFYIYDDAVCAVHHHSVVRVFLDGWLHPLNSSQYKKLTGHLHLDTCT